MGKPKLTVYQQEVFKSIRAINFRIQEVVKTFGQNSPVYRDYINKITAALPEGSYHYTRQQGTPTSGIIQLNKGRAAVEKMTKKQLQPIKKVPTVGQIKRDVKEEIARNRVRERFEGEKISKKQFSKEVKQEEEKIGREEVQRYIDDKSYVYQSMNEKGKIQYNADLKTLLSAKGKKSYAELRRILEGAGSNSEEKAKERANIEEVQQQYKADLERGRADAEA